jgi:methionine--tRNA ligase beta chain
MIDYDYFSKIELKVASIKEAVRVENSDKLILLKIDLGNEERQIVAGIATSYTAQELVGKQIIVVANLEPRQLMGLESQGMLLASSSENGPVLLIPDKAVKPGSKIS